MEKKENKRMHGYQVNGMVGAAKNQDTIRQAAAGVAGWGHTGDGLAALNTCRGGGKGVKGYVAEQLEAAHQTAAGRMMEVVNDNSLTDLYFIGKNGHRYPVQLKCGYTPSQIPYWKYPGHTLAVNADHPQFSAICREAEKYGVKVTRAMTTDRESQLVTAGMRAEGALNGTKHAPVVSRTYAAVRQAGEIHKAGMAGLQKGSISGAAFSLGSNTVDVLKGKKSLGEAVVDVGVDTIKSGAVGYGVSAAVSAVGSTTAGSAALGAVSGAAGAVSSAVAGTAVGGVVSTVAGAAAGTAATISTGVAAGLGAVGVGAATAGVIAVAAPAVIATAALGAVCSFVSDWFD